MRPHGASAGNPQRQQAAMHLAAGADPFNDLLPQIATLLKVHGVHQLGLLDEMGLREIDAVAGLAVDDAEGIGLREGQLRRAGGQQRLANDGCIERRDENPVAGLTGETRLHDEASRPGHRGEIGLGHRDLHRGERGRGAGALDG